MGELGRCYACQGDLEKREITYTTVHSGRVIVVENVPAEVCTQCGEPVFRPDVVEKLQKIVWGEVPETSEVTVPLYDFQKVA
jgi:YgiT-type zinc finger domain-containing protein